MARKKTANMEVQKRNHTSVFQILRKSDGLTKQDIVNKLQLCLPTVTQNINTLCAQGLVAECGSIGNTGGRRAKTFGIVKDFRIAIGMDITRTHVTTVAIDLTGDVIYKNTVHRKFKKGDEYLRFLGQQVELCVAELQISKEKVLGVGIGIPALVTADHSTVFYGKILNLSDMTCDAFSQHIPFPTLLINDANAAGFAETWVSPNIKTAFYLMLSNNIGGSIIMNGQTYNGDHYHSSEVGHICIERGGRSCYCGQRGCVDCYLAATELSNMTNGQIADFFKLLESGDAAAGKAFDIYLDNLAHTANTVFMLFDCPVILGGYVGAYIAPYMETIKKRAALLNPFEANADYLHECVYRTEAIAAGSALQFVDQFLSSI